MEIFYALLCSLLAGFYLAENHKLARSGRRYAPSARGVSPQCGVFLRALRRTLVWGGMAWAAGWVWSYLPLGSALGAYLLLVVAGLVALYIYLWAAGGRRRE